MKTLVWVALLLGATLGRAEELARTISTQTLETSINEKLRAGWRVKLMTEYKAPFGGPAMLVIFERPDPPLPEVEIEPAVPLDASAAEVRRQEFEQRRRAWFARQGRPYPGEGKRASDRTKPE